MPHFEHYDLPAHWACALLYGDHSGLDPEDTKQLEAWERSTGYDTLICVDVMGDDTDFRHFHDATNVGVLACDVARYTFDVGVPAPERQRKGKITGMMQYDPDGQPS